MQVMTVPAYVSEKVVMMWLGDESKAEKYEIVLEDGAELKVLGLFLGVGAESYDSYVKVVHRGENTKARICARGVVFEKSKLDFSGMLRVERGAIGTDTYFDARFMILGDEARAHTFPGLEIEENEIIKGGHAATVARIREEEMYYMMSRGLSRETAYVLLVSGYFEYVLSQIEGEQEKQVREKLKLRLGKYLGVFDA